MSSFKEMLLNDVDVFLNDEEFAEPHLVTTYGKNGPTQPKELPMIVESFDLEGRPVSSADGVSVTNVVVFIKPDVLGFLPRVGQELTLDNAKHKIYGVALEAGLYRISMSVNRGRP